MSDDIITPEQTRTLIASAMRDAVFRQALLADPHAALQHQLGVAVPADKTLHVVQGDIRSIAIVIPQRPADWPDNLSAEAAFERLMRHLPTLDNQTRQVPEKQVQIIARAWQDESFKQRLLDDPKAAVAQELGVSLPDDCTLQCFTNDADHQYLILPPALETLELTDEQLESVAGGEAALTIIGVTAAVAIASNIASYTTSW